MVSNRLQYKSLLAVLSRLSMFSLKTTKTKVFLIYSTLIIDMHSVKLLCYSYSSNLIIGFFETEKYEHIVRSHTKLHILLYNFFFYSAHKQCLLF